MQPNIQPCGQAWACKRNTRISLDRFLCEIPCACSFETVLVDVLIFLWDPVSCSSTLGNPPRSKSALHTCTDTGYGLNLSSWIRWSYEWTHPVSRNFPYGRCCLVGKHLDIKPTVNLCGTEINFIVMDAHPHPASCIASLWIYLSRQWTHPAYRHFVAMNLFIPAMNASCIQELRRYESIYPDDERILHTGTSSLWICWSWPWTHTVIIVIIATVARARFLWSETCSCVIRSTRKFV